MYCLLLMPSTQSLVAHELHFTQAARKDQSLGTVRVKTFGRVPISWTWLLLGLGPALDYSITKRSAAPTIRRSSRNAYFVCLTYGRVYWKRMLVVYSLVQLRPIGYRLYPL